MAPERSRRLYLPFAAWPAADHAAWAAAISEGDILDGRGPAAPWAPATRRTNVAHYSRWLGYLQHEGRLRADGQPETRVTADAVRGYVAHLQGQVAPRTVVSSLVGLKVMIKAMVPEGHWRWLADACNALNRTSLPRTRKRCRMRPTGEIYAAALAELRRLRGTPLRRRLDRVAFRDTLMLAMLAARPIRLKNFSRLGIGRHLLQKGGSWLIVIAGEEVKNRQPIEHALPESLGPWLDLYLERVRPSFAADGTNDALWRGFEGGPLTPHSIRGRILLVSERLLGVAINPHLLRDCAATSLATVSPAAALSAAALLGHRQFATTERYYIRANQLDAGRAINAVLAGLRVAAK